MDNELLRSLRSETIRLAAHVIPWESRWGPVPPPRVRTSWGKSSSLEAALGGILRSNNAFMRIIIDHDLGCTVLEITVPWPGGGGDYEITRNIPHRHLHSMRGVEDLYGVFIRVTQEMLAEAEIHRGIMGAV